MDGRGGGPCHLGRRVRPHRLRRRHRRPRLHDGLRCGDPLRDQPLLGRPAGGDARRPVCAEQGGRPRRVSRARRQQRLHQLPGAVAPAAGRPRLRRPRNQPSARAGRPVGARRAHARGGRGLAHQGRADPPAEPHSNLAGTQLLKQAAVVMLPYVLPDEYSDEVKPANYEYYEPLTLHKSSLSPAIHSIMSIEVGDPGRAVQYFRRSAFVDLVDNQGNTEEGIHIASAGGTWQMMVNGFGGFRVRNGQMTFKPWLPSGWTGISFRLKWRGSTLSVSANHSTAAFVLFGPEDGRETILV